MMSRIKGSSCFNMGHVFWTICFLGTVHLCFSIENHFEGNSRIINKRPVRQSTTLEDALEFLRVYNEEGSLALFTAYGVMWDYEANITDENAQKNAEASLKLAQFDKRSAIKAKEFDNVVADFPAEVQRQFEFIRDIGIAALDNETIEEYDGIMAKLSDIFSTTKICKPDNDSYCLYLDPGLESIMASSRDWEERLWAWKGFRDAVGIPNKPLYAKYVNLANQGARASGYEDQGHYWRAEYGDDIEEKVYEMYNDILPLYKQLHAYVRRRLHGVFGDNIDVNGGHLPANVLGDMWGRFWDKIYPMVIPYPDRPSVDVTEAMVEKGYNATHIFHTANEFFTSLGLIPVNDKFWENSRFTRPSDGREVTCHPSAWDLSHNDDFRILMCTEITMHHFMVAHHEMGHIQYFLQYQGQPLPFRDGANGAFHEAIGEVIALSVSTPKHLQEIGLFEGLDEGDTETDINFLLKTSLAAIATLPFSLALSQWRWDLMRGEYDVDNCMGPWWKLRNDLTGVDAPIERTEDDFDPGTINHIIIDYPFIGYFIRTILQFQFYQSLCHVANHTGPLHTCDFYNSKEAGQKLGNMLAMGRSKPWPDAMEALTGQREMKADAILEYFQPLMEWLERTNAENGEVIGWPTSNAAASVNLSKSILCLLVLPLLAWLLIQPRTC
ncbi:angiotensin-converting enzyme-like [Lytechinus variegatus]|uniref:angiotensin-converting enzyme-like n=1 Tax=Lytechinus variegatus TaxID=7654 RepID=UPI001BB1BF7D|nr:angiotensin-converting enzyme-like [Lytechinus variegatus]